jgi:2-methylisocitrate lyase-like PEP mutase family enzyme
MEGNAMRPRAAALKALLDQPGLQIMPVCGDGMGARLIEEAGFCTGFVSGSSIAAMRLAMTRSGLDRSAVAAPSW